MALIEDIVKEFDEEIYIRWLTDTKIVGYKEMYKEYKNNYYEEIKEFKNRYGVYIFMEKECCLYVGEAFRQDLPTRIKQHFRDGDKGGLRHKLRNNVKALKRLSASKLIVVPVCQNKKDAREIHFLESFLIAKLRPEINFKLKMQL